MKFREDPEGRAGFFGDVPEGAPGRLEAEATAVFGFMCTVRRGSRFPKMKLKWGGKHEGRATGFTGMASSSEGPGRVSPSTRAPKSGLGFLVRARG